MRYRFRKMIADTVLYVIKQVILILLDIFDVAFLVRAILSWIDPMDEFTVSKILYAITEPLIIPIRRLCDRLHLFQGMPLDMPFLLTLLLLVLVRSLLTAA